MESSFRGQSVLITGGAGAFGQKLVQYLEDLAPKSVTVLSRDEMKHAAAKRKFAKLPWLKFRIGDITNPTDVESAIRGADIVIHAAAMKHLGECEANASASTLVNVGGLQTVLRAFQRSDAKTFIFLSTDKAPYASSIYGAQKYMGEKLVCEAAADCGADSGAGKRCFSLRYSNVIDSTGAVFHLFGEQLRAGQKVTVNGSTTVRGFVTQAEVISCLETALRTARGGETIVLRPRVIAISELASQMHALLGKGEVEIRETTAYAGEKDSATLIMSEEKPFARELPEAPSEAYLLDMLGRHSGRKPATYGANETLTLEDCATISGTALREFLTPVMKAYNLI